MVAGGRRLGRGFPFPPRISRGPRRTVLDLNPCDGTASASLTPSDYIRCTQAKGRAEASCYIQEPLYNPTNYPTGVQRPYRIVIVDSALNKYGELTDFSIQSIEWELNGHGSMTFSIKSEDPLNLYLVPPKYEVQVWRGTQLVWWGIVLRSTQDKDQVTYQCQGLTWYFTRRYFGKADRTNYLNNPDFENGVNADKDWWDLTSAWFLTFFPPGDALGQRSRPNTTTKLTGSRSLALANVAYTTYPNGASLPAYIRDSIHYFKFQDVVVPGGTHGVKVTFVCWVYVPSGQAGWKPNYRQTGLVLARFSWSGSTPTVPRPLTGFDYSTTYSGTNSGSFGNYDWRNLYTGAKEVRFTRIDSNHVKDKWVRHVIEIDVPANTNEVIHARIEMPTVSDVSATSILIDSASVTVDESFFNTGASGEDQASIVQRVVEHAQDSAYGKSDLNIDTDCDSTGILRYRKWRFAEHPNIWDALAEFPTLYDGVDLSMELTPTSRTLTTYYPRKGVFDPGLWFEVGANLADDSSLELDGTKVANVIIVLGMGNDSGREEGSSSDTTSLGGLTLEQIYNGTPGADISTLDAQADRGLSRFKSPVIIPNLTISDPTGHLFNRLVIGNRYTVVMRYAGTLSALGTYFRLVKMSLNPNDETIKVTLNQEWT